LIKRNIEVKNKTASHNLNLESEPIEEMNVFIRLVPGSKELSKWLISTGK
jgi:hypothetical protein